MPRFDFENRSRDGEVIDHSAHNHVCVSVEIVLAIPRAYRNLVMSNSRIGPNGSSHHQYEPITIKSFVRNVLDAKNPYDEISRLHDTADNRHQAVELPIDDSLNDMDDRNDSE